jgi:hypothetical protein
MPSYSVRRSRIKEFKTICGGVPDSVAETILGEHDWDVSRSVNHFFNNRHKYPELKKGDVSRLGKLFKKYACTEDPDIMGESGMIKFFKDVNVDPEGVDTLAIAWHIRSTEMGLIVKDEFVKGFEGSGCSNIGDIKKRVQNVVKSLTDETQFKAFYKWIFLHVREDDKKKTIPAELAIALWQIIFKGKRTRKMTLFPQWVKFCETQSDMKYVSKDVWEQTYEFLNETTSIANFDDNGAWPVCIDEFVEVLSEAN